MFYNNNNNQNIETKQDIDDNKLTSIAISKKNRLILQKMGGAGESFNDVLNRLLKNQTLESVSRVGTRASDSNTQ
jgi:predicted CopG family antitoxin